VAAADYDLDGAIQHLGPQPSNVRREIRHPRFDEILVDGFESIPGRSGGRSATP